MSNLENPNKKEGAHAKEADFSIGARITNSGISQEKLQEAVILGTEKGIEVEEKSNRRNHSGNRKKADSSVLSETLEKNDIPTKRTPKKETLNIRKERNKVVEEIATIKTRIETAEEKGEQQAVENWQMRLAKAEDVLKEVEKVSTGDPKSVASFRTYTKEREEKLRSGLINKTLPQENTASEEVPTLTDVVIEGDNIEEPPTLENIVSKENNVEEIPTVTDVVIEGKNTEEPNVEPFTLSLEALSDVDPEHLEILKQLEQDIAKTERSVYDRAHKINVLEKIRDLGEMWRKIPLKYKVLFSAGMIASGAGAALAGAATLAGTITAMGAFTRAMGGASMFVGIEKILKKRSEKNGIPRTRFVEFRDTTIAATVSIILAGVAPSIIHDYIVAPEIPDIEDISAPSPEEVPVKGVAPATETEIRPDAVITHVETAIPGDSVWTMTERQLESTLGERFTSLSPEEQTYLIDAIKDKVVANPEMFGLSDANTINIGQEVDFSSIINNQELLEETVAKAEALSPRDISAIKNYDGETGETTEEITTATPETEAETVSDTTKNEPSYTPEAEAEIITPETKTFEPEAETYSPEIVAQQNEYVHKVADDLFGSKGFFGFGAIDGAETLSWNDPEVGFANKTVEEVVFAEPQILFGDEATYFGIENPEATEKMQEYLNNIYTETGEQPTEDETVEDYLKRTSLLTTNKE